MSDNRTYRPSLIKRFRKSEDGAALVELAILLPVFLMCFGMIVEGARMMWSYQAVIAGVRDASRYVARAAPRDMCVPGSTSAIPGQVTTKAIGLVQNTVEGQRLFPNGITVGTPTIVVNCTASTAYRGGSAPVVQVTAPLQIRFPFAGIFAWAGEDLTIINTVVVDRSRVFGV